MNLTATLALGLSCLLATSQGFAANAGKVYKWTDAKGQIHYAQRPPVGKQAELIKPQIGHSDPVTYATPASAEKANAEQTPKKASTTQAVKDFDAERCNLARQNVDALNSTARIRVKGEDGNYNFLSPEGRAEKMAEFNRIIQESCR